MAYRIIDEAGPTISTPAAVMLGIFFAIVAIIVNWTVYAAEFRDGSILTEQIDALTKPLIRKGAKSQQMTDEVRQLQEKINVLKHKQQQVAEDTLAAVGAQPKAAGQLILKARSYHLGTGWHSGAFDASRTNGHTGFIEPHFSVDVRPLQAAAKQRNELSSMS